MALILRNGGSQSPDRWLKEPRNNQSGMSEIYLHQIFAGRRNPSRNRLLCLCYGLGASIEEAQELLKLCGMAQLYPKLKRDAIIYYGLQHGLGLFEINDKLFDENEETLF